MARDIEKVLRSAIANAQQKEGFGGDVERLFVSTACYANKGPSHEAGPPGADGPRVPHREADDAHLTVEVTERPVKRRRRARRGEARTKPRRSRGESGRRSAARREIPPQAEGR